MSRTLDATLSAAMTSGNFTPYFNVQLMDSNRTSINFQTQNVIEFVMEGLTAKVSFHDPTYMDDWYTFRIQRGILVDGVPIIVTSSCYWPTSDRHLNQIRTLEGHVFPNSYYTTPGDVTYAQIINTVCAEYSFTPVFEDGAAAYLSYQFLPTGRSLTLNNAKAFFTMLRQKYLVFATDFDDDRLYFFQAKATGPTFPGDYLRVYADTIAIPGHGASKQKTLLSRDEFNTVHTSGGTNKPLHNLGFLPSTASHPNRYSFVDTNDQIIVNIPPHLRYMDFDAIYATTDVSTCMMWPAKFREVFSPLLSPPWQWQARHLDIFGNTEGGALPSTIEAAAPYTPLNTSHFDGMLDDRANNVQAAFEMLDDHVHPGGGGVPGGDTTEVQFNNGGAFGGADHLLYNSATGETTLNAPAGGGPNFMGTLRGTCDNVDSYGLLLYAGDTPDADTPGGTLAGSAGNGLGSGSGGGCLFTSGSGGATGDGGDMNFAGGSGIVGGTLNFFGGNAVEDGDGRGGDVFFFGGAGDGAGRGGNVDVNVGVPGATGDEGRIILTGQVKLVSTASPAAIDPGEAGDIAWDGDYFYICTAADTWEKVAISTSGSSGGSGDVTGPAGATAENIAAFDGVTGKIIKDSGIASGSLWRTILKTSDQAKTSDSALAADSLLQFSMDAPKVYHVRGVIFFDTAATPDFKYQFSSPASCTLIRFEMASCIAGGTPAESAIQTGVPGSTALVGSGTTGGFLRFDCIVQTSAGNPGTFSFDWAQNTSNASATTVRAGSYIEYISN